MMDTRLTAHLRTKIQAGSQGLARQFLPQPTTPGRFASADPLGEEARFSPVKGLVHKYPNRVLWKVTLRCAAHCQMCTRIRQIGSAEGDLTDADIDTAIEYLLAHPEIDDVILSGGDPLYAPVTCLNIVRRLASVQSVKVVRIGTRLPIQSPVSMKLPRVINTLEALQSAQFISYVLVHINHPDELDNDTLGALTTLRQFGFPVLSQTVFLRDVNDDADTLEMLFKKLYHVGVIPYYIYRCDYVAGLEHYVCPIETERALMTVLRSRMSGIAIPLYVADVADGIGKLPVPLNFWNVPDITRCSDFTGKQSRL